MGRVIGIDLGTTNSCVAVLDGGDAVVIPNAEGSRTTPSVVGFGRDGERFVGQVARRQAVTNPENTLYAIKRLIGRRFDDEEVSRAQKVTSYAITRGENGDAWATAGGRDWSPAEVSAMILDTMRAVAEDFLNEKVTEAVVTVPAYFNDSQRQATRDAGRIAGLNILRIINEPTAASLAYGLGHGQGDETIAVYDLGGGTFDISVLHLSDGLYEVLSTAGDTFLGGEDFDGRIIDMLAIGFLEESGVDPRNDPMALQRLKEAAERAKHELSVRTDTEVHLPFLTAGDDGPLHLTRTLTRSELEHATADLVERTLEACQIALDDAGVGPADISEVVLVGGQTRMPLVHQRVTDFFGREPNRSVNPDEVVAVGAAIQGGVLVGDIEEVVLLDVTPLSLGIETQGMFTKLIDRNTPIPTQASDVFTTALDLQDMVSVHVLQGERELAADNHSLARFELFGIPPMPRGGPQIEVTFSIDTNGMVSVTAEELVSGVEQSIRVVAAGGLDEDAIYQMIAEAESQRDADLQRVEILEVKNKVKGLVYTTEKSLKEYANYLQPAESEAIDKVIVYATGLIDDAEATLDEFHQALEELGESAARIAEAMYQNMMYESEDADPDKRE